MKELTENLKKGFTLVELLIVIAILAILAAAVVIVINPGEMLAQARDSQRMNDMSTLKSAINVYLTQTTTAIDLGACGAGGRCTYDPAAGNGPFSTTTCTTVSAVNTTAGGGWVDVNFGNIAGGSPIPYLPIDPVNSATYFYAYKCAEPANTYELDARLESAKFVPKMTTDGGDHNTCGTPTANTCFYEQGTAPGLAL